MSEQQWGVGMVLVRASRDLQAEGYWQEQVAGLDEAIAAGGGDLLLKIVPDEQAEQQTYEQWAAEGRIRSVVIENFHVGDTRRQLLTRLGLQPVVIGSADEAADSPAVRTTNNEEAARVAIEALHRLGHRVIAHVRGPAYFSHSIARSEAFARMSGELGITVVEVQGDYSRESGADALQTALEADDRVTAIVCDNDLMAVGALAQAEENSIEVPARLSIVAWDDSVRCQMSLPPLAALSHDVREVGRQAGAIAVQAHIGTNATSDAQPPVFLPRGTVAAPPASAN